MRPRNTLVLALLVAALGAFVYLYEIRGAEERAEAEQAAKRVFPGVVEAEAIQWIELTTEEGSAARLERDADGGWRLVEPVDFPADDAAASGIASALAGLESQRVFEEPEALESYGLQGEPTLRFGTAEAERALVVGDKTPVGGSTYVRSASEAPVYAVESYETNALRKTLEELRDARVLAFDRPRVRRIELRWPEGRVALEREGPEADWRLREPLEARADAETVDALLSDLRFLRADGFLDEPPPEAEVGLDEPQLAVRLLGEAEGEGGERSRLAELAVGGSVGEGRLAARGKVPGTLYALSRSRLEAFPREVDAYRYKRLASFDPSRAARFELHLRAEGSEERLELVGRRGEEGWRTEPEPMGGEQAARLVRELARLEAERVVAESMGEAERAALGLAPPRVRIRAWGAAPEGAGEDARGPLLADVALGAADAERGVAAMRADGEVVYRLDYALAAYLPVSLEAFRNRFRGEEAPEAAEGAMPAPGALPPPAGEGAPEPEVPGSAPGAPPSG